MSPLRGTVLDRSCPARRALDLVSAKWAMLILDTLAERPMRNGELLRCVGGISQKVLTETLRELECNGLVVRDDRRTLPLHVDYRLSDLGRSLNEVLITLDRWAERNLVELGAARETAP